MDSDLRRVVADHEERLREAEEAVTYFHAREAGIRLALRAIVGTLGAVVAVLSIAKLVGAI